jgi:hypothetical protein
VLGRLPSYKRGICSFSSCTTRGITKIGNYKDHVLKRES